MTTYQGPNASVKQEFVVTPGGITVESLPPALVATAYDVFYKESLGESYGIVDNELAWGADNVVYNKDVVDQRALDYYPPTNFANTIFGQLNLNTPSSQLSADGATVLREDSFAIPGVENTAGTSKAIIPYYKAILTAGDVQILATDLDTVVINGGAVVTAQIKPGQKVFITDDAGTSWTEVGTVGSIGNDETKVNLASPYTAAITIGDGIVVGAVSDALIDRPNTFYDPVGDFVIQRVKVGDVINLRSLAISTSMTGDGIFASITAVIDKNTLRFNTEALAAGSIDSDYLKYKAWAEEPGSTVNVWYYNINRYLGFSENYQIKALNAAAGVTVTRIGPTSFFVPSAGFPAMGEGDYFILTDTNPAAGAEERDTANMRVYMVDTVSLSAGTYIFNVSSEIFQTGPSGEVAFETGDFMSAWTPKVKTDVVSDFRAIRSEENGVVKRITSTEDIFNAWVRDGDETIDPRNELAFMVNAAFQASGGNVCYGVNVDSSAGGALAEYSAALDELKLIDCYSHAFGTTDGGVNALMSPYVLAQSDPYQAHEKIGILSYDEEDVYLMGVDTGDMSVIGLITINGAFNPLTSGLTVKDKVSIYDSLGVFQEEVTVTETPTLTTEIKTDGTTLYATGHTFKFFSGRKDDKALRVAALGIGERRVSVVWPGWFAADYGDDRITVPPYFISATATGMDSGIIASQSFTNFDFSIPGLSNLELNTNTYFRKEDLDEIGGGGIDIMVQDAAISQSIKSRHDLTTNMDAIQYRERSITKQADTAAKTIRNAVSPYVGKYNITPSLFKFLGQVCSIVSTRLVKDGILQKLDIIDIKRDEEIDDKINFYFEATVYVAGNYYDITLLVKTR